MQTQCFEFAVMYLSADFHRKSEKLASCITKVTKVSDNDKKLLHVTTENCRKIKDGKKLI